MIILYLCPALHTNHDLIYLNHLPYLQICHPHLLHILRKGARVVLGNKSFESDWLLEAIQAVTFHTLKNEDLCAMTAISIFVYGWALGKMPFKYTATSVCHYKNFLHSPF